MARLTGNARKLFEEPNFAAIATIMPDGSPQVSTVWVDLEDGQILVNTATGRRKTLNVEHDSQVAVSIFNQQNPYQQVTVRGKVVGMTTEGADAHIDKLAKKYLGQDRYPFRRPGEQRVILKIAPEHISRMNVEG